MFDVPEELDDLRNMVRELLAAKSTEQDVRRLMETDTGFDDSLWRDFAQLGLLSLGIPSKFGGDGFGLSTLGVVLEEMGRALVCAPYLTTLTAANFLVASGDTTACERYLPSIADGSLRATVAFPDWSTVAEHRIESSFRDQSWTLEGTLGYVVDGHTADLIVVVDQTPTATSLFVVDSRSPGLQARLLPTLDRTRKQASLVLEQVTAELVGDEYAAAPAVALACDQAFVSLALEQAGAASRVLDMAVNYAKQRIQFGRPIGSFQAIKHMLADLTVVVESSLSAARYGAAMADQDAASLAEVANMVKFYCSEAFLQVANSNIQVHGGIGFTWEHPAHLYLRRARAGALMLGDPQYHREQFLRRNFT